MAHYSFHKDLEQSHEAVGIVSSYIRNCGFAVRDTDIEEQIYGDLSYIKDDKNKYVEVKYDIMSEQTGNLCFEVFNGAGKPTGILRTLADEIVYLTKLNKNFILYVFNAEKLRSWIFSPANFNKTKLVFGGDFGRYKMILVSKNDLEGIAMKVIKLNAKV